MTKLKRPAKAQGVRQTKPAKVPPPQYEYTSNITIPGVGQSLEDERFLRVAVGDKTTLLNVDNIADPRSGELKKLTPLGEPLIKPAARTEFLARAHDVAREEPSFPVVTKTGWHGPEFVLPEGLAPQGQSTVARYFDERYRQYHRRLDRAGTIQGWLELAELCRGMTRCAGLCLSVTGPVCGVFGCEPPGYQLVAAGGWGSRPSGASPGLRGAVVWIRPAGSVAGSVGTRPTSTSRSSRRVNQMLSSSTTCTGPTGRTSRRSSRS